MAKRKPAAKRAPPAKPAARKRVNRASTSLTAIARSIWQKLLERVPKNAGFKPRSMRFAAVPRVYGFRVYVSGFSDRCMRLGLPQVTEETWPCRMWRSMMEGWTAT